MSDRTSTSQAPASLDKDVFLRTLIRELSGTLEEVVGFQEASGFVSIVGQKVGEWIDAEYRRHLDTERLDAQQVRDVLIDLKTRIDGDFYLISEDDEKIVLGNRRCPFGDRVLDRPSMCMMTSNVFGTITAENLGYARVNLEATIARGSKQCRVVVYKRESDDCGKADGRVYYGS